MKIDYNKMAFALATIVIAILVALGKLPASTLTFLAGWLLKQPHGDTQALPQTDGGAS